MSLQCFFSLFFFFLSSSSPSCQLLCKASELSEILEREKLSALRFSCSFVSYLVSAYAFLFGLCLRRIHPDTYLSYPFLVLFSHVSLTSLHSAPSVGVYIDPCLLFPCSSLILFFVSKGFVQLLRAGLVNLVSLSNKSLSGTMEGHAPVLSLFCSCYSSYGLILSVCSAVPIIDFVQNMKERWRLFLPLTFILSYTA